MVQGYYTLQEAAQHLNIAVDELKQMAQKSRIRSFQDRGTLRFRIQDIQELARQRGVSSDPDLVLGEASLPPKKGEGPRSPKTAPPPAGPKTPPRAEVPEVFDFEFDDSATMDMDEGLLPPEPSAKKPPAAKPKSGASPKSGIQPRSANVPQSKVGPKSPGQPKSGMTPRSGGQPKSAKKSDSDVKLVGGSDDVLRTLAPDSDIKLREKGSGPKTPGGSGMSPKPAAKPGPTPTPNPTVKRPSQLSPRSPQPADSGVRLVPMDDSDVKIVKTDDEVPLGEQPPGANVDSNVRLEKVNLPPQPEDAGTMLTDEINLDEELKKEEERIKKLKGRPSKVKLKSELRFPTTSPFELSDSDVGGPVAKQVAQAAGAPAAPAGSDSSDFDLAAAAPEGSSDFDLAAAKGGDSSNFDLAAIKAEAPSAGGSDDDFSLELSDDEPNRGELSAPASGISLGNPIDAGISLEDKGSDDSLEFDLSLEPEATPRPAQMKEVEGDEGSSEFELSLELGDGPAGGGADSDSEFELTLDDSDAGNLQSDDAPQIKAGGEEETQDIFESDFDIPALQAEGDSAAPATVDSEIESSDFDLALDDSELAADEESGSQVVALDEEEVEPVADGDELEVTDVEEGEFGGLEGEEGEVEAAADTRPPRVVVQDKILRPAPWGVLPMIVMFPCVVVMLLVGLVGFEVVQSSVGHRPPGLMTRALNDGVLEPMGISSVKLDKR
jgi:hypothetical protein